MILSTNQKKNNNNLISLKNEFEKTTLFWLECLIFWVEF
jgi:hypothetical protein